MNKDKETSPGRTRPSYSPQLSLPTNSLMICRSCLTASRCRLPSSLRPLVSGPSFRLVRRNITVIASRRPSARHQQIPNSTTLGAQLLQACQSRRTSFSTTSSVSELPKPSAAASPEKPDFLDEAESRIWDLLANEFSPVELSVRDISGGCGSMYGIDVCSEKFRGANMLKQQRMVNAVLGDMMKDWHGVQLKTRAP